MTPGEVVGLVERERAAYAAGQCTAAELVDVLAEAVLSLAVVLQGDPLGETGSLAEAIRQDEDALRAMRRARS